jgi:tetratricopeptide (TPR) repeat protein
MNRISTNPFRTMVLAASMILAVAILHPVAARSEGADEPAQTESSQSALSEYAIGVFLLESGGPQKAIPHLENAWRLGKSEQAGNTLCEAYFRAGDLRSCERIADELIEIDDHNPDAVLYKARIAYFRDDLDVALEHLQKLRGFAEPSFEVERLAGRIQLELGRYEDAMVSYEKAIRLDDGQPVMHYRLGVLYRRFERDQDAERALRKALELQPVFEEAVVELAEILIEEKRYDEAQPLLLGLLEMGGGFHQALMMAVDLLVERKNTGEAIRLLEDRARQDALTREATLVLARLYYETGNYAGALEIFRGLFNQDGQSAELARVLGEVAHKAGQADSALHYYRKAIELGPDDYRNYIALFIASSRGFTGSASSVLDVPESQKADLLSRASATVPADDFEGIYALGVCYENIGDYDRARAFFERALELRPDDEGALLNLAGVLERSKRYEEAERLVAKLHDRKPSDPKICNFYGYLLALMNTRLDEAERLIVTALKQEPENGYYIDSLGWVYFMRGEYDKAVVHLERASELVRDDPVILEHLGDAYQSLSRFRDALAAYKKSMDLQGENAGIQDKIEATRDRIGN